MDYQAFKEELMNRIVDLDGFDVTKDQIRFYEKGFTSEKPGDQKFIRATNLKYFQKESDTLLGDFIVVKFIPKETGDHQSRSNRFEMNYLYHDVFADGDWDAVMNVIKENFELAAAMENHPVLENLTDYALTKEHLIIRPLNFTARKYEMKDFCYRKVGDIALVLYAQISADKGFVSSTPMKKSLTDDWNVDMEKVWEEALLNTYVKAQPRLYTRERDVMHVSETDSPGIGAFMAIGAALPKVNKLFPPLLTTTMQRNGAIALFYPGVMEKLAEIMGGDYYAAFTSVDDVRIHSVRDISARVVLTSVKDTNKNCNAKEDVLSNKVYLYSTDTKELKVLEL